MGPNAPRASKPTAALLWLALIVSCTALGLGLAMRFHVAPISNPTDFRAFYCGARVLTEHRDPYLVEPLRACENGVLAAGRLQWIRGLVVPAPLPPYALALLGTIAWLPFLLASSLWCAITIAVWLRTVGLLRKLTGMPLRQVAIAMFALGLFVSFAYGQIVPVAIWLVVEAAARLHNGRVRAAALFATGALIEPQLGGPVFLAIFILRPESRRTLALGGTALAVLALAFAGPAECVEWFFRVLPAQGQSEIRNPEQFGFTTILSYLGASPRVAALGGSLSYAIAVALGIWVAAGVEKRWNDAAVVALVPAAFSAVGGPYVHQHQLAAVVPIALLGYARTRDPAFVAAFTLLSCPWLSLAEAYAPLHDVFWPWHPIVIGSVAPDALAETVWATFMAAIVPGPQAMAIATLVKLPFWAGIGCAIVPLLRAASLRRVAAAAPALGPLG